MDMTLKITPNVTVHDLLLAYPQLEETLIDAAPPFRKLRNPMLRKSVAKVATLKHIASVGGLQLDDLIDVLCNAVGQSPTHEQYQAPNYFGDQPDWFSEDKIVVSIEEATLENRDEMTLIAILRAAKDVAQGEIIELVTTFLPAPGIDQLKARGYSVWTMRADNEIVKSYFLKNR